MSMMSLDNTIWIAGIVTEAAVVGLLIYRRIWRQLPLFCVYCVWDLAINLIGFLSERFFPSGINWTTYLIQTAMDSVLQFCVLVEVAWSVLRPIRGSLPRFTIVVVGVILLVIGAAIWPFTTLPNLAEKPIEQQLLVHLQQSVAILRILFFLILAGCSQLLSLGWRDRELQVATGLGLYSLVSLGVTIVQARSPMGSEYARLYLFVIAGFLCSLLYWAFSFAQKQAERRKFTPQMQSLLLAVAGVARAERAALNESAAATQRHKKV
jgi:hypothetical protein